MTHESFNCSWQNTIHEVVSDENCFVDRVSVVLPGIREPAGGIVNFPVVCKEGTADLRSKTLVD